MMLSRSQKEVLARLRKTAEVALYKAKFTTLPVQPRTHVLVCGPSGVGKSHLCRELGKELGVPVLALNCSSWVLLASSSDRYTWDAIVKFLDEHERGIIVLDEIDKIDGRSDWQRHLRLEIHDLLDGVIPPAINVPFDDGSTGFWGEQEPARDEDKPKETEEGKRALLASRLKESFMVVGAGAWQHLWDSSETQGMGFNPDHQAMSIPTQKQLQSSISPEILKRFQSRIEVIAAMTRGDYLDQVASLMESLEPGQAARLQGRAAETLEHALQNQQGMRWMEELVLDAIMHPGPVTPFISSNSGVMKARELFGEEFMVRFQQEQPESISLEDFAAGFKTF